MTSLQLWFLALLMGMILLISTMRIKKGEHAGITFFQIITINDNKKILLAHAIIDIAIIGLYITFSLSLLPNWFYVICFLSTLIVFGRNLYQSQRYFVEAYLEEVREKGRIKNQ